MIGPALRLSLVVAVLATLVVGVLGTATGWLLARKRFRGRELLDAVLSLPLVLPPTVSGYYLLVLLGRRGLLGEPLHRLTGFSVTFTWVACVIAAAVMSFPLMLRAARVAFEGVDRRHELAAATLGRGPLATLLSVTLPLARRGLTAGLILTFARSLGEFGATLMLAGSIPGRTQTLPLAIYEAVVTGEDRAAQWMALLLTLLSLTVMITANRLERRRR